MPRHFRRKVRLSQTRESLVHSDTLVVTHGPSSIPSSFVVLDTEAGARSLDGTPKAVQAGQNTAEETNVGSIVKYMNIFIESAVRPVEADNDDEAVGWLEWALVMVKQTETSMPITNVGTLTIGNIAKNMYRNECIFTGCMPLGKFQPNCQSIVIKVPRFKQKITIGDQWRLLIYFRDVVATASETNSCRTILSTMWKSWQ